MSNGLAIALVVLIAGFLLLDHFVLNLGAPLLLLGAFGAVRAWRRKRRYAGFGA